MGFANQYAVARSLFNCGAAQGRPPDRGCVVGDDMVVQSPEWATKAGGTLSLAGTMLNLTPPADLRFPYT